MSGQVFQFGSGALLATPNFGDLAANPSPSQFGTLQDVDVEITFADKELHGRNQFADDVARGKSSIKFKAKYARIRAKQINDLVFGQTVTAGQKKLQLDEEQTVTTGAATVVPPGSGTFSEDLGVRYKSGGQQFSKKASAPAVGEYTNAATTAYGFNTGDNTVVVLISYWYTVTAGFTTAITNKLMGYSPKFSMALMEQYGGNQSNMKLYRCLANKLTRPTKNDDYMITDFEGTCSADDSGNVFDFYDTE